MKNWKQKYAKYDMKIKQYGGVLDIVCTFGFTGVITMPTVSRDINDINIIIKPELGFTPLGLEFTIKIPDYFLEFSKNIKNIKITNDTSYPISIGNKFLAFSSNLISLDLSSLQNITSVGYGFLEGCSHLTTLDLSPLQNIKSLEYGFLSGCFRLTSIDLSPLKNITSVGGEFCKGCFSLTTLDLSPLQNIKSVDNDFLSSCTNLTSIDLSPLRNITSIGESFLRRCKLTSIDLSPLRNITSIGKKFLDECYNLKSIYHVSQQKEIILLVNPNLAELLIDKILIDSYWNYTGESRYNIDYTKFCEEMMPHSLMVLRKILDHFTIPYSITDDKVKLCRILYDENKKYTEKYTEEEIKNMCNNETEDPISKDEFKEMPKNKITRLEKNDYSGVDKCYGTEGLRNWCSQDRFRRAGICEDPMSRKDLFQSHPEKMFNLMREEEDKYVTYFNDDV
jgi:hypothetical protein